MLKFLHKKSEDLLIYIRKEERRTLDENTPLNMKIPLNPISNQSWTFFNQLNKDVPIKKQCRFNSV